MTEEKKNLLKEKGALLQKQAEINAELERREMARNVEVASDAVSKGDYKKQVQAMEDAWDTPDNLRPEIEQQKLMGEIEVLEAELEGIKSKIEENKNTGKTRIDQILARKKKRIKDELTEKRKKLNLLGKATPIKKGSVSARGYVALSKRQGKKWQKFADQRLQKDADSAFTEIDKKTAAEEIKKTLRGTDIRLRKAEAAPVNMSTETAEETSGNTPEPLLTEEELLNKKKEEILSIPKIKKFIEDQSGLLNSSNHQDRMAAERKLKEIMADPLAAIRGDYDYFEEELAKNPNSKILKNRLGEARKLIDQIDVINNKYERQEDESDFAKTFKNTLLQKIDNIPEGSPITESVQPTEKEKKDLLEIDKEIASLPAKKKMELGKGILSFGFRVEKWKNSFWANRFNNLEKKFDDRSDQGDTVYRGGEKFNETGGTMYRWTKALQNNFEKQKEKAQKQIDEIYADKAGLKTKAMSQAKLAGNILKYGRTLYDVGKWTTGAPWRFIMAGGMAISAGSKAGVEARFENKDLIEQTRVQDQAVAYEEAWALHGSFEINKSKEELEAAYLAALPKEIKKRLENPEAAVNWVQGAYKVRIGYALGNLDKKIKKIEGNSKLNDETKKERVATLLKSYGEVLRDFDRMLTQAGTIDQWVLAGKAGQVAGKAVMASSIIRLVYDKVEHLFSHGVASTVEAHHPGALGNHEARISGVGHTVDTQPSAADAAGGAPHAEVSGAMKSVEIKFDHGKGGIQGIVDLKHQIVEKYGSIEKSPAELQEFLKGSSTKQAMEFGLFDPNHANESALIHEGSTLKFENGHLVFHDAKTGIDVTKYETKMGMLDSDHSGQAPAVEHAEANPVEHPEAGRFEHATKGIRFDAEHIKAGIESKMDAATQSMPGHSAAESAMNAKESALREVMENSGYSSVSKGVAINEYNLSKLFPNNSLNMWEAASKQLRAIDILKNPTIGVSEFNKHTLYGNIFHYLQKVQEVTGLKPKGASIFHWKSESVASYAERCLKFIEEKHPERLKDLILK